MTSSTKRGHLQPSVPLDFNILPAFSHEGREEHAPSGTDSHISSRRSKTEHPIQTNRINIQTSIQYKEKPGGKKEEKRGRRSDLHLLNSPTNKILTAKGEYSRKILAMDSCHSQPQIDGLGTRSLRSLDTDPARK